MSPRKKRPTNSLGTAPGKAPGGEARRPVSIPAARAATGRADGGPPGKHPGVPAKGATPAASAHPARGKPVPSSPVSLPPAGPALPAGVQAASARAAGKGGAKAKAPAKPMAAGKPMAPAKPMTAAKPMTPAKPKAPAKPGPTTPAGTGPAGRGRAPRGALPKGGPTKAECKKYREALLARRRALLASSKELAAEALQSGGGEFSVDHMADHGSDNYEQDFNLKLLQGEAEQLGEIRDALLKLDGKGELPYGLCEACADDSVGKCPTCPWIPATRLEAIPHARLCVPMKEREEARG